MIDLFQPPQVTPQPTRRVLLTNICDERPPRPAPAPRPPRPAFDRAAYMRDYQRRWTRNRRRNDLEWTLTQRERDRRRYAALTPQQRAARIAQITARRAHHGDQHGE